MDHVFARERRAHDDGRAEGRIETLRLVCIAAACAEVFYDRLGDRYANARYYDRERRDLYDFAALSAHENSAILSPLRS